MAFKNQARYVVKPLENPSKTRGYRLEIDEFMEDPAMVNLFLLALDAMQQGSLDEIDGEPDWLKYYGLASIHGRPTEDWNHWEQNPQKSYGYCRHSLDTFPTWHRPYMMLYETTVHTNMVAVAKNFSEPHKTKYLNAAARFRLPYLDPIMPRYEYDSSKPLENIWGCPKILTQELVYVRTPGNPENLTPLRNPLNSFKFPEKEDWDKKRTTHRKPFFQPSEFVQDRTVKLPDDKGKTSLNELEQSFRLQAVSLATKLWRMLSPDYMAFNAKGDQVSLNAARSWTTFANNTTNNWWDEKKFPLSEFAAKGFRTEKADVGKVINPDKPGITWAERNRLIDKVPAVSIESWHDAVHGLIGGSRDTRKIVGQMGDPRYAAFDPIFWLHHNNIDRLLSLYQAMYGQNFEGADGTLAPFQKDTARTLYKSSDALVFNYWSPGFAVPGAEPIVPGDRKTITDLMRTYLTETYYWAANKIPPSGKMQKNWPKNLSNSEVLTGVKLVSTAVPDTSSITAMRFDAAKPTLVSQTFKIAASEESMVDNKVIDLDNTLARASAVDEATPDDRSGAITESWNAHIRVRKFAFNGPFTVHIFIGWVKNEQPERYYTKKNEVGFSYVFASSAEYECSSCEKNRENDIVFADVVPMTNTLTDYLASNPKSDGLIAQGEHKTIQSLEPEHVAPFLEEHLQWRIVDSAGNVVLGQEEAAGLEVMVASSDFKTPDADNIMGYYGDPVIYPEITSMKPGGLGYVYAS